MGEDATSGAMPDDGWARERIRGDIDVGFRAVGQAEEGLALGKSHGRDSGTGVVLQVVIKSRRLGWCSGSLIVGGSIVGW